MEARLPDDKLLRIRTQLAAWLGKKKATKREILSLVGLLQHVTNARWRNQGGLSYLECI